MKLFFRIFIYFLLLYSFSSFAEKDPKYLIVSCAHGNQDALDTIATKYKNEGFTHILFNGDLNDRDMNPRAILNQLFSSLRPLDIPKENIKIMGGNADLDDAERGILKQLGGDTPEIRAQKMRDLLGEFGAYLSDPVSPGFKSQMEEMQLHKVEIDGKAAFGAVHVPLEAPPNRSNTLKMKDQLRGFVDPFLKETTVENPNLYSYPKDVPVVFTGHTHLPDLYKDPKSGTIIVNTGSLASMGRRPGKRQTPMSVVSYRPKSKTLNFYTSKKLDTGGDDFIKGPDIDLDKVELDFDSPKNPVFDYDDTHPGAIAAKNCLAKSLEAIK